MPDHRLTLASDRALLALDCGAVTGWAFGRFTERAPSCDVWPLPRADDDDLVGARASALDATLAGALDAWPNVVTLVLAERFVGRNQASDAMQGALEGVVRAECWRRRIRVLVQPEVTVRKEVLGRGSGKSEVMKALALQWCERNGISVPDHNAADAVVLWVWARGEIVRQRAGFVERTKSHSAPSQLGLPGVAGGS